MYKFQLNVEALYKRLSKQGYSILKSKINDVGKFGFQVVDPEGILIKVLPKEHTYGQTSLAHSLI
jgi:uncharacterized glyoxalase superfamily protein PhnB